MKWSDLAFPTAMLVLGAGYLALFGDAERGICSRDLLEDRRTSDSRLRSAEPRDADHV